MNQLELRQAKRIKRIAKHASQQLLNLVEDLEDGSRPEVKDEEFCWPDITFGVDNIECDLARIRCLVKNLQETFENGDG